MLLRSRGSASAKALSGAPFGGGAGCNAAFHELGARAVSDVRFAYRQRAVVDAYCLRHPRYIESLKSFAAHLCGLCASIQRPDDPRAERTIWSDLRIPQDAVKPAIPECRGSLTLVDAHRADMQQAFQEAIDVWLADVWAARRQQHGLARAWLDYSIASRRR